jgi:signal transduction histidine kinase
MSSGEPEKHSPATRLPFWRSLRWRLSVWYVALLAIILLGLGAVLLVIMGHLLLSSTNQRFQQEAYSAAESHHTLYEADTLKNAAGTCPGSYVDAFQTNLVDPLTQPPAHMQTVLLVDPFTGMILAPSAMAGQALSAQEQAALATLVAQVGPRPLQWRTADLHKWDYEMIQVKGRPTGLALIAYDYRTVTACTPVVKTLAYPAVLLMTQDFSPTQATVNSFARDLALSVGALLVLGFAIGVPLTGASLRRLSRITTAAQQLAQGDLHQRVGITPQEDEIGLLARHFDDMASALEAAFVQQQQSEERVRMFLADASHELRTPLTSVRGYLDVLAQRLGSTDPQVQHILRATQGEAERMTRLVQDMLTLARFDMGRPIEPAWTDLVQLAGEAVDDARMVAGARQVLLQTDGQGRMMAPVDRDRIKQVLVGLLSNALKYGRQDPGGWVRVEMARRTDAARIVVRDNGPGIAAEDIPYVFERFYRGKHRGEETVDPPQNGSGLGLAIAHAIVVAHGGTITVASPPGQGASFTIVLPLGATLLLTAMRNSA